MNLLDILLLIIALLILFTALSIVVMSMIWIERKFLGRLQRRLGPTRTGPFGLIQPVADAVKLVLKEDLIPSWADRAIFWVAPLLVLIPSFMIWVTIPAAKGLVLRNLDLGLFVIVALLVVSILGLLLAGWGSANKYGALGGLRSAAQLVSYEVPLVMVVVSVAILAESLDLRVIAASQVPMGVAEDVLNEVSDAGKTFNHIGVPLILIFPLGMVLFLIAGLAEVGRIPFDIYFAESEIVGGPFVEYSGAHFSVFFLAEYIKHLPGRGIGRPLLPWRLVTGPFLPEWIWFLVKTYAIVVVIFWIRGTFPRLRVDQLMAFGWKGMIPLSFVGVVICAVYRFYDWPAWTMTVMSLAVLGVVGYWLYRRFTQPVQRLAKLYGRATREGRKC